MPSEDGSGPAFFGRSETVRAVRRRLEEALHGKGGVTLLVGDTGVGKSILVSELVRDMRSRAVHAFIGQALALDEPPPYSLLQSALDSGNVDSTSWTDEQPTRSSKPPNGGFGLSPTKAAVPIPTGMEEALLDFLGGPGGAGSRPRDSILTVIADRLHELAREGPTVIVLDDLDRADELSLSAVEFLANELKDRPCWILATSRSQASLPKSVRARLAQLERVTHAQQILLPPLTSVEVSDYLRTHEPSRAYSPEEVARRYSETGGNPLRLQQLVRRESTGTAVHDSSGTSLSLEDEAAQQVLDLSAVIGPEFALDILLRASGEEENHLSQVVDRLVLRGLLIERPGRTFSFPTDRLRGEAYGHLIEERRRLLHVRVGEALEATRRPSVSRTFVLAHHYYLGREGRKSVEYNRLAARYAERALAPEVAAVHYSRALESEQELSPGDPDVGAELTLDLARIKEELGLLKEAEGILRGFLHQENESPRLSLGIRATVEIFLARVLIAEGDNSAAVALAEKVLATPGIEDQLLVRIGAHRQAGQVMYYSGRFAEALAHHTEEIRLAREAGNDFVLVRAQVWRIAALQMIGETEQAITEARELTALRDGFDSARESAQAHLFYGDILADARSTPAQRQEAIVQYATAIRFAESANDPRRIAWALYKTAELLREAARRSREAAVRTNLLKEGSEKLERSHEVFVRIGDRVGLSLTLKVRGQMEIDQGAYGPAEVDLLEAHRLLQGLHNTLVEIDVLLRLAQLSLARGDREKARERVAELELQNVHGARPDLEAEFEQLRKALGLAS